MFMVHSLMLGRGSIPRNTPKKQHMRPLKKRVDDRTQFEKDWEKPMIIDNMEANKGYYNLICSIRDLGLYAEHGMKPHRNWKIGDVKKYFGVKGNKHAVLQRLKDFKDGKL